MLNDKDAAVVKSLRAAADNIEKGRWRLEDDRLTVTRFKINGDNNLTGVTFELRFAKGVDLDAKRT